ncbi:hypothetical protein [Thalassoroseus pseudoceratinae]|uniref:hypothetical protein n=1 Tax=Thalassoroseus pseudoceratinae TaxID=2713176 RepID=UPI00141F9F87|nr:hypothetical protein [Thalassoroseus pseudoceratinae]
MSFAFTMTNGYWEVKSLVVKLFGRRCRIVFRVALQWRNRIGHGEIVAVSTGHIRAAIHALETMGHQVVASDGECRGAQ